MNAGAPCPRQAGMYHKIIASPGRARQARLCQRIQAGGPALA